MSVSFNFPKMIEDIGNTKLIEGKKAVSQNLKLMLLSTKNSQLGDPNYGTNLKRLIFNPRDVIIQDIVIDEIFTAIRLFMPEITVGRNNIQIKVQRGVIYAEIVAKFNVDNTINLYSIPLIESEEIV